MKNFEEPNHLLFRLKTCVEFELTQNTSSFVSASLGLKNQLRTCLVEILDHGLIQRSTNINDLKLSSPLLNHLIAIFGKFHPEKKDYSALILSVETWVNFCILEQALADHFKLFLADKAILQSLYTNDAFLLSVAYADALVLCLQALELKKPEFLAEIDPILFLSTNCGVKSGQSSVSTPVLSENISEFRRSTFSVVSLGKLEKNQSRKTGELTETAQDKEAHYCIEGLACPYCVEKSLNQMVDFVSSEEPRIGMDDAQISGVAVSAKKGHRRAVSDFVLDKTEQVGGDCGQGQSITIKDDVESPQKPHSLKRAQTLRVNTRPRRAQDDQRDFHWLKKSLENTQQSLVDARLRDLEISIELERENTHFYLSEMLIAAVEQMKWGQMTAEIGLRPGEDCHSSAQGSFPRVYSPTSGLGQGGDSEYPFSEVSLSELKDRDLPSSLELESELNRRRYLETPSTSSYYVDESGRSRTGRSGESRSITPTSSQQLSPPSLPGVIPSGSLSTSSSVWQEESGEEIGPLVQAGNLAKENRPSAEEKERAESSTSSAEAVAASLLRYFSRKIRPTAAEMEWLVSYRDAPQLILPLPTSSPVMPDEFFQEEGGSVRKVRLRGTQDWAPPRPQVIFRLHPPPKLKALLTAQHYRCAGCGLKLDKSVYQKRVRYCEYLGRFFCQVCHRGSHTLIPARIIHRWDFRLFPVSDFGHRFLSEQAKTPMFDVGVINKKLLDEVKAMKTLREKRKQLRQMWDYVRTCRVAGEVVTKDGNLKELFLKLPGHFLDEVDVYALADFSRVKDGTLEKAVDTVLFMGKTHIEGCQHCKAQGFLCEVCRRSDVLFPFQVESVYQCKLCGVCNHLKCCRKNKFICPKCTRIKERRRKEQALAALARATSTESPILESVDDREWRSGEQTQTTAIDYSASVVLA